KRAKALSESEVEALALSLLPGEPRPAPRDLIRPLSPGQNPVPARDLFTSGTEVTPAPAPKTEPLPQRHLLQMTVGPRFLAQLEEVRAALSHKHPAPSLEDLFEACMEAFLTEHARTTRAKVKRPRANLPEAETRPSNGRT